MWVAELACPHGHGFEGWFASRADFDAQREWQMVSCPHCGSAQIERRLSAPRLNLGASQPEAQPETQVRPAAEPAPQAAEMLRELLATMLAHTEDLGRGFAQEARRIHQGQAPERAIRGQADAQELQELRDEGVPVWSLPLAQPRPAEDEQLH